MGRAYIGFEQMSFRRLVALPSSRMQKQREAEAQQELGKKSGIGGSILSLPSPLSLSARILSAVVSGSGSDAPCSDLPAGAPPPEWAVRREGEHAEKKLTWRFRYGFDTDSMRIRCEFDADSCW